MHHTQQEGVLSRVVRGLIVLRTQMEEEELVLQLLGSATHHSAAESQV